METLKSKKLPFGISCTYTRANAEVIGSEEYFNEMIEKGVKFAWFFTYIPIGKNAVPELIATPEQREYMYHQLRKFRQTKPIFTLDFWNDGEYSGGCIAGGRRYLHINANGDIEPCAFIHYSDSNIHNTTPVSYTHLIVHHDKLPFHRFKPGDEDIGVPQVGLGYTILFRNLKSETAPFLLVKQPGKNRR